MHDSAFRSALNTIATKKRHMFSDHQTPKTLDAFAAGILTGTLAADLRDHLSLCADCVSLLLAFHYRADERKRRFRQLPLGTNEAAWRALRCRLAGEGLVPSED